MAKINRHIEIVSSSVIGLSSMSKVSRDAAHKLLSKHYKHVGITIVNNLTDLELLVAKAPDVVLLGMKFITGHSSLALAGQKKIWLAEYLQERGIATTGSSSTAHRIDRDKSLSKKCVQNAGFNTPDYFVARMNGPLTPDLVPSEYPLFVKPADGGGGTGIDSDSVVYNFVQLKNKVEAIASFPGSDSLIETYLSGREFSVAILRTDESAEYSIMPIELIAPRDENGARILSDSVKSSNAEQVQYVPSGTVRKMVSELALEAFHAIGGRDYGRIDIRMDSRGVPHFLEANLIPSLIDEYGSFPKACALNSGIDYEDMMLKILDLGMSRHESTREYRIPAFAMS